MTKGMICKFTESTTAFVELTENPTFSLHMFESKDHIFPPTFINENQVARYLDAKIAFFSSIRSVRSSSRMETVEMLFSHSNVRAARRKPVFEFK